MKFSIVIPVYNVEPYLKDTLNSVLAQNYADFEVICVDDGSKDFSGKILDEYAAKDGRIKVLHQSNQGVGATRTVGLMDASGDWILFLDGDDLLHPQCLEVLSRQIAGGNDFQLVQFRAECFSSERWCPNVIRHPLVAEVEDISTRITSRAYNGVLFVQYAYSRSVIADSVFPNFERGEDLVFMAECLARADSVVYLPSVLYGYRQRIGSSIHSSTSVKRVADQIGYRLMLLRVFEDSGKRIDRGIVRYVYLMMTEWYVDEMWREFSSKDRDILWRMWLHALPKLIRCSLAPPWFKFVCRACRFMPFRFVAVVLCLFPLRLKKMGIHR